MGAKQKVRTVPYRLTDRLTKRHRLRNITHRGHMPAAPRVGASRVKLHRRIAAVYRIQCTFCRHLGRGPERPEIMVWQRIKIGVGPHACIHHAAEQRIDGPLPRFAQNIPARNLKPRKCAHHCQIRPLGKAGGIGSPEHHFDILGVLAGHMACKYILDHGAHGVRPNGGSITLPPADNPAARCDLDQYPIPTAPTGCWRCRDNNVQILQLHRVTPSQIQSRRCIAHLRICFPLTDQTGSHCGGRNLFWCPQSLH